MKHLMRFNLIEILLTVAVIAFGVSVILGMLPRGLLMTREAGVESYASEIIDQMAGFFFTEPNAVSGLTASATAGATADPDVMANYIGLLKYMDLATTMEEPESDYFARTGTSGVFKVKNTDGVYVIVMGDTYDDGEGETENRVDFSGMLRVWQETPDDVYIVALNDVEMNAEKTAWKTGFPALSKFSAQKQASASHGIERVCMELSYPLSRPYNQRTKRYYSFEVKQ